MDTSRRSASSWPSARLGDEGNASPDPGAHPSAALSHFSKLFAKQGPPPMQPPTAKTVVLLPSGINWPCKTEASDNDLMPEACPGPVLPTTTHATCLQQLSIVLLRVRGNVDTGGGPALPTKRTLRGSCPQINQEGRHRPDSVQNKSARASRASPGERPRMPWFLFT